MPRATAAQAPAAVAAQGHAAVASRPAAAPIRGGSVGALAGALAIAAHGAAGGGYPESSGVALLLIAAGLAGGAAGALGRQALFGRTALLDRTALLGLLGIGQLAGHAALSGRLVHDHAAPAESPLPQGWMLLAHAIATFACAALILVAERLYAVASGAVRAVLTAPRTTGIIGRVSWSNPGLPHYVFHPNGAIGPRAPPVPA
ncbi:hypothetical protein [Nocardia sp. NPDC052566]|uniref:hypothetical protein n=1 Tax=Nocardia sp. NPDC052566 TaxID=3364330 RepID=UPI0037C5AEC4